MNEIEHYQIGGPGSRDHQAEAVTRLTEWATSAQAAMQVAEQLAQSSFVPQSFRGKPGEATAAILAGLEVGLQPMAALRSFDVIQGQAAPRAVTLRAIVQSHGHEIELVESTNSRCRMRGRRRGTDEWQTVSWTFDRARQLGLTTKNNWKAQPQAMLVARATSEIARLIAADAILGVAYSSEEIADGAGAGVEVAAVTTVESEGSGTKRMSRRPKPVSEDGDEPVDAEVIEEEPKQTVAAAKIALVAMLDGSKEAAAAIWAAGPCADAAGTDEVSDADWQALEAAAAEALAGEDEGGES